MRTDSRERPSRPDRPPPARTAAAGPAPPSSWQDAHLDGLFTYCLSVMCEHDAATAALGEALAVAERQDRRGRRPADPELLRPWLYALARWACLRRLAARRASAPAGTPEGADGPDGEDAGRRRRELAALSWPEATGLTHAQREALELAVRHRLPAAEVARVLRLSESAAGTLLAAAAREVERTRAALAAVESGVCPAAAALSGDDRRVLLGRGLRRELLRHVDECTSCRLLAQRALAGLDPAAGAPGADRLAVLPAPRGAVRAARLAVTRARAQHTPRFDRSGFPLAEGDRAARRERLRGRAVTTTVVVAVVAAPVLALWAAWRDAPDTGEATLAGPGGAAATAEDRSGTGVGDGLTYGTGTLPSATGVEPGGGRDGRRPGARDGRRGPGGEPAEEPTGSASGSPGTAPADDGAPAGDDGDGPAAGTLSAVAERTDAGAVLTLTASGDGPVSWSATPDAAWLVLERTSGTLQPGESAVVTVTVDTAREPAGPWQGRITIAPSGTVITVEGAGPEPEPTEPPPPTEPEPTGPPPDEPADPPPADAGESG